MSINQILEIAGAIIAFLVSTLLGVIIKAVKNGKAKKVLQEVKNQLDEKINVAEIVKKAVAYAEKLGGVPSIKLGNALNYVQMWEVSERVKGRAMELDYLSVTEQIEELVDYTKTVNAPSASTAKIMLELTENEAQELKEYLQRQQEDASNESAITE